MPTNQPNPVAAAAIAAKNAAANRKLREEYATIQATVDAAREILAHVRANIQAGIASKIAGCNNVLEDCRAKIKQAIVESFAQASSTYKNVSAVITSNLGYLLSAATQYAGLLGYPGVQPGSLGITQSPHTATLRGQSIDAYAAVGGSLSSMPARAGRTPATAGEAARGVSTGSRVPPLVQREVRPVAVPPATAYASRSQMPNVQPYVAGSPVTGSLRSTEPVAGKLQGRAGVKVSTPAQAPAWNLSTSSSGPAVPSAALPPAVSIAGLPPAIIPPIALPVSPAASTPSLLPGSVLPSAVQAACSSTAKPVIGDVVKRAVGLNDSANWVQVENATCDYSLIDIFPNTNPANPAQGQWVTGISALLPDGLTGVIVPLGDPDQTCPTGDGVTGLAVITRCVPGSSLTSGAGNTGPSQGQLGGPASPGETCPVLTPWQVANCPAPASTLPIPQDTPPCGCLDVSSLCKCIMDAANAVATSRDIPPAYDLDTPLAFRFAPDDDDWKNAAIAYEGQWLAEFNYSPDPVSYAKLVFDGMPSPTEADN